MKILGREIKVIREKGLIENKNICGYYDFDRRLISIDASLTGKKYQETFMHEFFHAVGHRAGLFQTAMPLDLHEIIAETFAHAVVESGGDIARLLKRK